MPNITTIFKQEITRLARKEIKIHTGSLRKATAQERKDIAALKRQITELQRHIKKLIRQQAATTTTPATETEEGKAIRFRKEGVIAQRKRLGLSQADFGKLIGVTLQSVYHWEHGKSKPRRGQLAALAGIRGIGKREAVSRLEQGGKTAGMGKKGRKGKS